MSEQADMLAHARRYAHLRRVVCAAIRSADGDVMIGVRHYCPTMRRLIRARPDGEKFFGHKREVEQGFIDQWGNFLTRTEAWLIAQRQGQIIERVGGDAVDGGTLYSENLY